MSKTLKIVYIAGLSHSGSTLLDLMIGAHSQTFSVGEIRVFRKYAHMERTKGEEHPLGNECTCGAPTIWQCPFWSRVDDLARAAAGPSLKDLEIESGEPVTFSKHNKVLFEAVAEASGRRIIVDSSKYPPRLSMLLAAEGLDVVPIFLIRQPRGQIYSQLMRRRSLLRTSIVYVRLTRAIHRVLDGRRYIVVRYEDLVTEPERELRGIMRHVGLDYEPGQLEWAGRECHNLSGNLIRRNSSSALTLDLRWRTGLSLGQRLAIDVLTAPAVLANARRAREAASAA